MDTMAFVAPGAPQQNLRASPPSMLKTVMPPKSLALSSHPGRPDGAVEASTFETPPQHGSGTLLVLAGGVGVAASRASRARTVSKAAAAVMEVAAGTSADEEELPPPPPPPFDPAKQLGVTEPLGFFDPLGFSKVGDEEGFRKLRIAEMKHGRVAMMASVGAVVQHYLQFPGFDKVPKGLFAITDGQGAIGFAVLVAISGLLELVLWKDDFAKDVSSIGDYGNPFQLGLGDPLGESEGMRNRELNNGRAAMIATLGIIVAELATGKDGMQQMGFS